MKGLIPLSDKYNSDQVDSQLFAIQGRLLKSDQWKKQIYFYLKIGLGIIKQKMWLFYVLKGKKKGYMLCYSAPLKSSPLHTMTASCVVICLYSRCRGFAHLQYLLVYSSCRGQDHRVFNITV